MDEHYALIPPTVITLAVGLLTFSVSLYMQRERAHRVKLAQRKRITRRVFDFHREETPMCRYALLSLGCGLLSLVTAPLLMPLFGIVLPLVGVFVTPFAWLALYFGHHAIIRIQPRERSRHVAFACSGRALAHGRIALSVCAFVFWLHLLMQ